jgi:hypothetical protein
MSMATTSNTFTWGVLPDGNLYGSLATTEGNVAAFQNHGTQHMAGVVERKHEKWIVQPILPGYYGKREQMAIILSHLLLNPAELPQSGCTFCAFFGGVMLYNGPNREQCIAKVTTNIHLAVHTYTVTVVPISS